MIIENKTGAALMSLSRRDARERVFELLFEWSFNEDKNKEDILANAIDARGVVVDDFAESLYNQTIDNVSEIDDIIEQYSEKRSFKQISRVCLTSLRMAFCELLYFEDIPVGATINEAVELAKKFGTEDEATYLNGILGKYSRSNNK